MKNIMLKRLALLFMAALFIFMSACGDADNADNNENTGVIDMQDILINEQEDEPSIL